MVLPEEITREHILEALKKLDIGGWPTEHDSTKYALVYNEKEYPPKYVVVTASKVSGKPITTNDFSGGDETNNFLSKRGFKIIEKRETDMEQEGKSEQSNNKKYYDEGFKKYLEEGRIEFITFHPSYSYEDFIEGIRPKTEENSHEIIYVKEDGIFKKICARALHAAVTGEIKGDVNWRDEWDNYNEDKDSVDFKEAPRFVVIIDELIS